MIYLKKYENYNFNYFKKYVIACFYNKNFFILKTTNNKNNTSSKIYYDKYYFYDENDNKFQTTTTIETYYNLTDTSFINILYQSDYLQECKDMISILVNSNKFNI